jgi:hypothetical protein
VVTVSVVAPVIPPTSRGGRAEPGQGGRVRRPLPLPALGPCSDAMETVYALSGVDKAGRVTDRGVVHGLGWSPGTRLDIREQDGVIVVQRAVDGVHCISQRAFLKVPLTVRRWCGIPPGGRVLLAAYGTAGVLLIYPLARLHAVLADVHAAVLAGEPT